MLRVFVLICCISFLIHIEGCLRISDPYSQVNSLVEIPNEAFEIMNSDNIKALGTNQNFQQFSFKIIKKMSDLRWLDDIDRDFIDKQYQICIPAYGGQKYAPIHNIDGTCRMQILRYYFSEDKRTLVSLVGEYTGCNEQCVNCGDTLSVSIPIRKLDQQVNLESAKSEFVNVLCKNGSVIKNNENIVGGY